MPTQSRELPIAPVVELEPEEPGVPGLLEVELPPDPPEEPLAIIDFIMESNLAFIEGSSMSDDMMDSRRCRSVGSLEIPSMTDIVVWRRVFACPGFVSACCVKRSETSDIPVATSGVANAARCSLRFC